MGCLIKMINLSKVQIHKEFGIKEPNYQLLIDGYIVNDVKVGENYKDSLGLPNYYIISKTDESLQKLTVLTLFEFNSARVESINLTNWTRWEGFNISVSFHPEFQSKKYIEFEVEFEPDLVNWNFPYSYNTYYEIFRNNWEKEIDKDPLFGVGGNKDKFMPVVKAKLNDLSIREEIENNIKQFAEIHKKTLSQLKQAQLENSLFTSFNFPSNLKVSCEQYLLYFAQFLQDLGINATSNLKEEAGKVLFSVTPTDDIKALDKIREALAIYLSLSSNPIPNSTGDRTVDMVLSGARANAKHLESQLELAIAKLQFKEATLELKDATIEQNQIALRQRDDTIKDLKEMLARGNIFEESLEKVVINGEVVEETSLYRFSREDDIEVEAKPILEEQSEETRIGLVKFHEVTKLKDYGVSLDLPKAIRGLIDYFKRDKDSR